MTIKYETIVSYVSDAMLRIWTHSAPRRVR